VAEKKRERVLNLHWGALDQDDKEVVLKVVKENPAWARILLYGETRPGSEEENEALLRHNDGLFDALFIMTADGTMRMRRYDSAVTRLFVPSGPLRRAWEIEEEHLGLRGLDDSLEFLTAIYIRLMERMDGHMCYPFQLSGGPIPAWREERVGTMYVGAWILFKKTHLFDIPMVRFFATLPRGWFADIALRELDAQESALALSVARTGRPSLTNGELGALKTFEENNRLLAERKEDNRANRFGAWRSVL
jgi:hypothetical protein